MSDLGYTTVALPSKGALYDGAIPDGEVQIRRMLGRELTLLNSSGSTLDRLEGILKATVQLPGAFQLADLLVTDRMYLLLAVRTATYGPDYRFDWRCQFCGSTGRWDVNILTDLDESSGGVQMAGHDHPVLVEPFEFTLPESEKVLGLRLLRGRDERALMVHARRGRMQGTDGADPSELFRISLHIETIDGEKPEGALARQRFMDTISAKDLLAVQDAIDKAEPGIDLTVYPECDVCRASSKLEMPFDMEFFRPSRR